MWCAILATALLLAQPTGSITPAGNSSPVTPATGTQPATGSREEPTIYDRIWRFTELYNDAKNPVVQRVLFTGRYQHDYANVSADQGDADEWNVRRMRVGSRVTLFHRYLLHVETELNPQEHDPFYVRLTDAYLQWSRQPTFVVTVGKQSVPFTSDGATSSRELIAIDRSNLANNMWFPQEYMPGVAVSGRRAPWTYRAGIYTAGAANREFGEFSGGVFTLGVLGYDFARSLGVREALLAGHYVYQQPDADNSFTRPLEHVASVNFKLEAGRWGLRTDVSGAVGYLRQSDLWGAMIMPYVNVTTRLQAVGRYTRVASDELNGVQLGTYENRIVRGRGNRYDELYLGANYYFYGHRLKLQTGVQFGEMQDRANDGGAYSGTSWTTGVRVGW